MTMIRYLYHFSSLIALTGTINSESYLQVMG
jgi:hypothetical protein